ncbi:LamG-like jellyroll fold domain-containing protein [Actinoplanes sp. NPDC051346]|uniref:LamG-like jellyroll fold domain-containing protein n=1 Tax=Actinoplanes sp. NPDC051346 TaxID=3155048 RepID=UPI00341FC2D7
MRTLARWAATLVALSATTVVIGTVTVVRGHLMAEPPRQVAVAAEPDGDAYRRESIRVMTWNICGEAGSSRGRPGYCAWRGRPAAKAAAIATVARQRDLNVIMLQEACYTATESGRTGSNNHLEPLLALLGPEWTFRTAEVPRAGSGSRCRGGLNGTIGNVLAVRGKITSATTTPLLVANDPLYYPDQGTDRTSSLLCVRVDGWRSTPCVTHLLHNQDAEYARETASLTAKVAAVDGVVLGGDFNTQLGNSPNSALKALFARYPECDQRAYLPGDAVNEPTHFDPGVTESPTVTPTKLDYIFAAAGFTGCDSLVELADPTVNTSGAEDPLGFSDHAPVVATTRGSALTWRFDEDGGRTVADTSGNGLTGTISGDVTRSNARGHSLQFGGAGTVTAADGIIPMDTRRSITVSMWARPAAGSSGTALSQSGNAAAGLVLAHDAPGQWRFAMATGDLPGAKVDQVTAPAKAGEWAHLVARYDAVGGQMSLFVNGALAGTAAHTTRMSANGLPVLGTTWVGGIDDLRLFGYPLSDGEIAELRAEQTMRPAIPTRTDTVPDAGPRGPGCDQNGEYGTVASLTPQLTATVTHDDPTARVYAEFSIWDNTDKSAPQPISLGGPGSASGAVTGSGTVSVRVPTLIKGHRYGWYVRGTDGTSTSPTATRCHFVAGAPDLGN